MKLRLIGLVSLCAVTLPLSLSAQQQPQEPNADVAANRSVEQVPAATGQEAIVAPAAALAGERPIFDSLDTDHDGRISMTEAQLSEPVKNEFGSIDTNKDSFLSIEEYVGPAPAAPQ